nr:cytochrome c oxidase subunit III [Armandia sp. GK-2021]
MNRQPFHLVEMSPWPLTGSMGAFATAMGLVKWFSQGCLTLLLFGLFLIVLTMIQWWRDIVRESTFMGHHTSPVVKAHRLGMVLLIVSEVFFFLSFFWAFFHSSWSVHPALGCVWPPIGIQAMDPLAVPLLNTGLLLSSGATVTWAHHSVLCGDGKGSVQGLLVTVFLGAIFTLLQVMEYQEAPFTIADSVYGSVFFVATGFHGLHVLIGSTLMVVCLFRASYNHFAPVHHVGLEAAVWYWHFVDVVWIFLYLCLYWWGS